MPVRETIRRRGLAVLTLVLVGCGGGDALKGKDVYGIVLDRVSEELRLAGEILIHPFPARVNLDEREEGPLQGFNTYDPDVMRAVAASNRSYRLCETSPAGICQVAEGGVAVVLSELHDLEQNGTGLIAAVHDRREPGPLRYFAIRVKRGITGRWSIVQFSAME